MGKHQIISLPGKADIQVRPCLHFAQPLVSTWGTYSVVRVTPEPTVGQAVPAEATLLHSSFIRSLLLSSLPFFKFMNPILLMGKLRHREVKDFPKSHTACKRWTLDPRLFDSKHWATTLHYCTDLFIYIIYLTILATVYLLPLKCKLLENMDFVLFSPQLYTRGRTEVQVLFQALKYLLHSIAPMTSNPSFWI